MIEQDERFYFAPDSTIWHINRERVLLLLGSRTLLMQIAHPLVAEAVYEHSIVFDRPIKRLFRTLELTLALVFGTRARVYEAARAINQAHTPVQGTLDEAVGPYERGTPYDAHDPELGLWIFATLVEGALTGYEHLVAPLDEGAKAAFYAESRRVATLLGVGEGYLPASMDDLLAYMDDLIAGNAVIVSNHAREIAPYVLGQSPILFRPFSVPLVQLTAGFLAPELREQYGLSFHDWEARLLRGFCRWSRRIVPHLPGPVRYVPQYRHAMRSAGS